ncbi:MAG: flagellar hook-associated protein FlgK [Gammaproteobacteria bacterium]
MASYNTVGMGLSGLMAAQRSLNTTSNNIANVGTDGYSRQRTDQAASAGSVGLSSELGLGVNILGTSRFHDSYLTQELNRVSAESSLAETQHALSARVDNLLSDASTSLSGYLNNFSSAVEGVSASPTTIAERQVLIGEAQRLASTFNTLDGELTSLNSETSARIEDTVRNVNELSASIAELNEQIALASASGQAPNTLLDQRDQAVNDLSGAIGIQTLTRSNGDLDIYSLSGESLVQGTRASELSTAQDPAHPDRLLVVNRDGSDISSKLNDGALGGLLQFRDDVLEPARDELNRLATALGHEVNAQQHLGLDLYGNEGADLFSVQEPGLMAATSNTGSGVVSASIADGGGLTTSEYRLSSVDGADAYTLTRLSDGQTFAIDTGGAASFTTDVIDGFQIDISAGAAAGDSFLIQPVGNAARDIGVTLSDPYGIAAAAPVLASVNPDNSGTATIAALDVTSSENLPLNAAPVSGDLALTFDASVNQFTLVPDPFGESPIDYDPASDAGGKTISLLDGSLSITLEGQPVDGDELILRHNGDGSGDNRNALKLGELLSGGLLDGGETSIDEGYTGLMSRVAIKTQSSEASAQTFGNMVSQVETLREGVSGVNLDEEAANLIKFQQAYRASAQVISAADDLFNTLLQVVAR